MVKLCKHWLRNVCALEVKFMLNDGKIHSIEFKGGCNGNLKAISRLAEGMNAKDVADILRGIRCGDKMTSCGDQLAAAINKELS
jgi:uncharacterized protein (TIGR03905 family)